ncbi:cell division protein ZapA [Gammaproteobacteria bacterium 45_16_T64]|nr:cell division protein ZapA [Gammaproteobacteria bacterium 45_16_T64]
MTKDQKAVNIKILDKEFGVSCPPEEEQELLNSARLVDTKMREIRQSGKIVGMDRIAVMAALNIAHELIKAQNELSKHGDGAEKQLARIHEKIELALAEARQMDL